MFTPATYNTAECHTHRKGQHICIMQPLQKKNGQPVYPVHSFCKVDDRPRKKRTFDFFFFLPIKRRICSILPSITKQPELFARLAHDDFPRQTPTQAPARHADSFRRCRVLQRSRHDQEGVSYLCFIAVHGPKKHTKWCHNESLNFRDVRKNY